MTKLNEEHIKHECCEKNENIIRYGKRGNIQRYKCKVCGKTFSEHKPNYFKINRNTRKILSVLLNILENNFFNEKDLEQALNHSDYNKLVKQIVFNTEYVNKAEKKININCYNPKLLICQDDKNITFIQIPPKIKNNNLNDNDNIRSIIIIDNDCFANLKSINNANITPLAKEE